MFMKVKIEKFSQGFPHINHGMDYEYTKVFISTIEAIIRSPRNICHNQPYIIHLYCYIITSKSAPKLALHQPDIVTFKSAIKKTLNHLQNYHNITLNSALILALKTSLKQTQYHLEICSKINP